MNGVLIGFVVGCLLVGWMAWLWTSDMRRLLREFVNETVDYMALNNLGDPEKQHNVKWARRVLCDPQSKETDDAN